MKLKIGLALSEDLVKAIDGRRGLIPRSAYVENELRKSLMEGPCEQVTCDKEGPLSRGLPVCSSLEIENKLFQNSQRKNSSPASGEAR